MTDAEYLVLSTFIYAAQFFGVQKGNRIKDCMTDFQAHLENDEINEVGGMNKEQWSAFADKMQAMIDHNPSFRDYEIRDYANDEVTGFRAITFISSDKKDVVVVFRGTAESYGWIDNGQAMYLPSSTCQREAAEYIEKIHNKYSNAAISVCGHSKGGNLAQYVTIVCPYIAKCVAFDGQGFSTAFINDMKANCPESDALCKKITNISAEGDFVNCLGTSIAGTVKFVPTIDLGDFNINYHSPWYLVQALDENFNLPEDGEAKSYTSTINTITVALSDGGIKNAPIIDFAMFAVSVLRSSNKFEALKETIVKLKDSIVNEFNFYVVEPIMNWVDLFQKDPFSAIKVEIEQVYRASKEIVVEKILKAISVVNITYEILKKGVSKVQEAIKETIDLVKDVARQITYVSVAAMKSISQKIVSALEKVGKEVNKLMSIVNPGQEYVSEHPAIKLDTSKLRSYASTLGFINSTLAGIDRQMNSLYLRVGFTDLWNLLKADLGTSYSFRLRQCISYLEETASDFEVVESAIEARI